MKINIKTLTTLLVLILIYLINKVYPLTYIIYTPLLFISDNLINFGNEINEYLNSNELTETTPQENKELENDMLISNKTLIIVSIVLLISVISIYYNFIAGLEIDKIEAVSKLDKLSVIKKSLNDQFNRNEHLLNELDKLLENFK
jgi:hypothetical protein